MDAPYINLFNLHLEEKVKCLEINDLVRLITIMTNREIDSLINILRLDPQMDMLVEFLERIQRN